MKFFLKIFFISFTFIQIASAGRMYDPEIGRFISRDPLGYVDGMSQYNAYFAEKFALDPTGFATEADVKIKIHDKYGAKLFDEINGFFDYLYENDKDCAEFLAKSYAEYDIKLKKKINGDLKRIGEPFNTWYVPGVSAYHDTQKGDGSWLITIAATSGTVTEIWEYKVYRILEWKDADDQGEEKYNKCNDCKTKYGDEVIVEGEVDFTSVGGKYYTHKWKSDSPPTNREIDRVLSEQEENQPGISNAWRNSYVRQVMRHNQ